MNIIKMTLLVLAIILIACKPDSPIISLDYITELENLTTDDSKKAYLENILIEDQEVRGDEDVEIMLNYGKDSQQYEDFINKMKMQDSINLLKIEKYFELYGYPTKALGDGAATAPWMVIHHTGGYELRDKHFDTIYNAYLHGNIDDGAISFYLRRMYRFKFGKLMDMESPFKAEDEINKYIREMGLEDRRDALRR